MKDLEKSKNIFGIETEVYVDFGYPRRTIFSRGWRDST